MILYYSSVLFCQIYFDTFLLFTVLHLIFLVLCIVLVTSLSPSSRATTESSWLETVFGTFLVPFSIREIVVVLRAGLKKNHRSCWDILQSSRSVWSLVQIDIKRQFYYSLIVRLNPSLSIQTFRKVMFEEEMVVGSKTVWNRSIIPWISIYTPENHGPLDLYHGIWCSIWKNILCELHKVFLLFISEFWNDITSKFSSGYHIESIILFFTILRAISFTLSFTEKSWVQFQFSTIRWAQPT